MLDSSSQHAFTVDGFRNWKRVNDNERCPFLVHIGKGNSRHKKEVASLDGLTNITRHIDKVINCQSLEEMKKNRLRWRATIEVVQYLSLQACVLRGHDESSTSRNRGNIIEMIKVFDRLSVDISNVVLENAPKNAMYTSPKVQKNILHILAPKVRNEICDEVGYSKFCILVDESIYASHKEQMAIVLRFVDVHCIIRERFFDIINVADTTSLTLKKEIFDVLTRYNLSIHNMIGQGYDGASNMRGAFNGLQALFLKDCPYAYYVHYFAHRLQLALVGAAEKQDSIWEFFSILSNVVNIIIGSSKRLLELQTTHEIKVDNSVAIGERETGRGLNQIGNLQRSGSTMWSSHFNCICSLIDKFGSIITLSENINNCSSSSNSVHGEARDDKSVEHHYHYDVFNSAIDFQLEELHYRFNDETVQLLRLSTSLEPKNNFSLFDIKHICALATTFNHADFGQQEMYHLKLQLDHYKIDGVNHAKFQDLSTLSDLCLQLVDTAAPQFMLPEKNWITREITFPNSKIAELRAYQEFKDKVHGVEGDLIYTRNDLVTAILYRCAVAAAASSNSGVYHKSVLMQAVNMRPLFDPPLPETSVGNIFTFNPVITTKATVIDTAFVNNIVMMDTPDRDGIKAIVSLEEEDMENFLVDKELRTYASV
ncbi:hypothetical protein AgCh_030517 [Apium graveolens]